MRVLITGGAGFIGSHLAERHLQMGDEVDVIDNFATGSIENIKHLEENPKFTYTVADVSNVKAMGCLLYTSDAADE
mgnify:CR=1 FL=1